MLVSLIILEVNSVNRAFSLCISTDEFTRNSKNIPAVYPPVHSSWNLPSGHAWCMHEFRLMSGMAYPTLLESSFVTCTAAMRSSHWSVQFNIFSKGNRSVFKCQRASQHFFKSKPVCRIWVLMSWRAIKHMLNGFSSCTIQQYLP